jgi:translocation and assembly module TamA
VARTRLVLLSTALVLAGLSGRARADQAKASVEGVTDSGLRAALERVIGRSKAAPASRLEARRRAQSAAEDAIVVLRSESYYGYDVEPDVVGDPPRAVLKITPGPRYLLQDPKVEWVGAPPAPGVATVASAAMNLKPGQPGRASDVVAAEGRIVAALQKRGYADVVTDPREVVVDHADHSVQPTFRIDAANLVVLDSIKVKTKGRTNPLWVKHLTPWKPGKVYDPNLVGELERRLLDTGVYDSVTVALAPVDQVDAKGERPVIVSLADRARATVTLGASYSTYEGVGVDASYTLYNRLHRADTLSFIGAYSSIEKRLQVELSLPHWRAPQQTLKLDAVAFQDDTDAYREEDVGLRADLQKRIGKTSYRTFGVSVDANNNDEKELVDDQVVGVNRKFISFATLAGLTLDRSDDPLNPTRGWRVDGRLQPTIAFGDQTLTYVRAQTQGSAYLPIGSSTVLAGRVKLGSILGGDIPDVPAAQRLFAGGGGSVRGYGYQAVGPRFPDNTPIGGLSLAEASFEVRQNFTSQWGGVVFVDTGSVGQNQYPAFKDVSTGVGFGVRYNPGFAPIRADVAFPLNKRPGDGAFQVYLSIGQSF